MQKNLIFWMVSTLFCWLISVPSLAEVVPLPEQVQAELDYALDRTLGLTFSETSPLHKEFFGEATDGSVYTEFLSRIEAFSYREVDNEGTVAVVRAGQPTVYITQNFVTRDNQGWLDNASILLHEVRHIFNGEGRFGHIKCPEIDFEGEPLVGHSSGLVLHNLRACDGHHRGAYGHQVVMLGNIAQHCTNCTDETKERALYLADRMLRRVVNNPGAYQKLKVDIGL